MKKLAFALSTLITLATLIFIPLSFSQNNDSNDSQSCTVTSTNTANASDGGHTNGG